MDHFEYHQQQLFAEQVALHDIAKHYGTPCYVYSRATLERHWHAFDQALGEQPHLICYAVKASSNLAILNCLARLGSGFDVVSLGELERVLAAGGTADKVIFSGVGKTAHEIEQALHHGIYCFNVESAAELELVSSIAKKNQKTAPISLRINPDVDAKTHPYISTGLKENKFGIHIDEAYCLYLKAAADPHLAILGLDCHIGSQLTELSPFLDALNRLMTMKKALNAQGITISHLDLGGGLGVRYRDEKPPEPHEYAAAIKTAIDCPNLKIILEPGRAIAANAGVLLTQVQYLKASEAKHFAIIDAAMNDLLRPALYQAYQDIIPVNATQSAPLAIYDIVGPVCETGDFLGKDRRLSLQKGDLLAVRSAGAYGFSMSSNYNTRPRAAEVMVDGKQHHLIRRRETIADLFEHEQCLPHSRNNEHAN